MHFSTTDRGGQHRQQPAPESRPDVGLSPVAVRFQTAKSRGLRPLHPLNFKLQSRPVPSGRTADSFPGEKSQQKRLLPARSVFPRRTQFIRRGRKLGNCVPSDSSSPTPPDELLRLGAPGTVALRSDPPGGKRPRSGAAGGGWMNAGRTKVRRLAGRNPPVLILNEPGGYP